jgi:hypothetical protein
LNTVSAAEATRRAGARFGLGAARGSDGGRLGQAPIRRRRSKPIPVFHSRPAVGRSGQGIEAAGEQCWLPRLEPGALPNSGIFRKTVSFGNGRGVVSR